MRSLWLVDTERATGNDHEVSHLWEGTDMTLPVEKIGVRDHVVASMSKARTIKSKMQIVSNVHVVLTGPDGVVKYDEWIENLVTDYGDQFIAEREYLDATDVISGMRLGTGSTAASKAGAGGAIVTYISGSQEALDATATDSDLGAGSGHRTQYVCTWIAGDVTNSAIAETVLTNETPITDVAGAVGNTVARFVFASTIDKQAADQLVVTWQLDKLGA